MKNYLNTRTGQILVGTFSEAVAASNGDMVVRCNEQGNTCLYNGDATGHSKGFCTADACY